MAREGEPARAETVIGHARGWFLVAAFVVYGALLGYTVHHIDTQQDSINRNAQAARRAAGASAVAAEEARQNAKVILQNQAKLDLLLHNQERLIAGEELLCRTFKQEEVRERHPVSFTCRVPNPGQRASDGVANP